MDFKTEQIGLRVAAALLMHQKEITTKDIEAIPFFTTHDQAKSAVEYLVQTFNARIYSKQVASQPIPEWEQVISIRK